MRLSLTDVIWFLVKGVPTITLFRHALIANIALAFEHRTIWPKGRSCIKCSNSSRSTNERSSKFRTGTYTLTHLSCQTPCLYSQVAPQVSNGARLPHPHPQLPLQIHSDEEFLYSQSPIPHQPRSTLTAGVYNPDISIESKQKSPNIT